MAWAKKIIQLSVCPINGMLVTITHNGLRLKKEGIESTTLPPTTKLYRMHNCSITTEAPLSFKRVLAAVASTNVHSRHEPFFLKTFLGEVFYFSFFLCISKTLCIFALK